MRTCYAESGCPNREAKISEESESLTLRLCAFASLREAFPYHL